MVSKALERSSFTLRELLVLLSVLLHHLIGILSSDNELSNADFQLVKIWWVAKLFSWIFTVQSVIIFNITHSQNKRLRTRRHPLVTQYRYIHIPNKNIYIWDNMVMKSSLKALEKSQAISTLQSELRLLTPPTVWLLHPYMHVLDVHFNVDSGLQFEKVFMGNLFTFRFLKIFVWQIAAGIQDYLVF